MDSSFSLSGRNGNLQNYTIFRKKCFCVVTCFIFILAIITAFSFDFICGIFILLSYSVGCVGITIILKIGNHNVPNVIFMFRRPKHYSTPINFKHCTVCGKVECRRHRPELNIYQMKPWAGLKVPKEVDKAVEEILSLILKKHVYSWYSSISADESFVQEIRISFRFLFSTLLRRAQQVDIIHLITVKIAKALLRHVNFFLHGELKCKVPDKVQQAVLSCYGPYLHTALQNRDSELNYIRQLTESLLPYVMQRKYLQCRSACTLVREIVTGIVTLPVMDIIADPDIINHLLIIFFDKTPMIEYDDTKEPKIEFLENFISSFAPSRHPILHADMETVLNDRQLLYHFMQFLKEEASVNVLQFYLSVDDFNSKILNPELTKDETEALHAMAQEMYNTYFAPNAVDKINFDDDVVKEMKEIISGPPEDVVKLQTTTPLFRAYDHAYNLLEQTFCPMFLQSDLYFSLMCGERCSNILSHTGKIGKRSAELSSKFKLSSKTKGCPTVYLDDRQCDDAYEDTIDSVENTIYSDNCGNDDGYRMEDDPRLKKLNAWRVSVPEVTTRMDQNCKYYYTFTIEIQRIDVRDEDNPDDLHWTVERRYNEFYVLEAKLIEFHGDLPVQLPAKRTLGNRGMQFLESRRTDFEKFLQSLLTVPSLQGSELLYKFLKTPVEFTTSFLPEIKLGKMIKTVPMKLMKEKGQHLFPFLQAFLASTEASKPKPSKQDWKEIHDVPFPSFKEKVKSVLYGNNCAQFSIDPVSCDNVKFVDVPLDGIYDYIMYLAVFIYKVPDWTLRLLATFDILARQTLQAYVECFLDRKLHQILKPQRIAEILGLLRDALFFSDHQPRTKGQKAERAQLALKKGKDFFPDWLIRILGLDRHKDGTTLLFNILQNPVLNKQLSYVLLDIVVLELFPELQTKKETPSP